MFLSAHYDFFFKADPDKQLFLAVTHLHLTISGRTFYCKVDVYFL